MIGAARPRFPIAAVRHIESMIRISEAHESLSCVLQEDADMAIGILLDSFMSTQKFGVQKALQKIWQGLASIPFLSCSRTEVTIKLAP